MNKPLINILTRCHGKADYFNVCRSSIEQQTYQNINWIVGSDIPCDYYPNHIPLNLVQKSDVIVPEGHYYCPWNLHLNTLNTYVKDGWVLAIDEDDMFASSDALEVIVNNIENEDQMLIWRVQITPDFIVPRLQDFGKIIAAGNISGVGYMYHSKHNPVDWGYFSYGDYRVAIELLQKGLKPKFINRILTRTIAGPHNGK